MKSILYNAYSIDDFALFHYLSVASARHYNPDYHILMTLSRSPGLITTGWGKRALDLVDEVLVCKDPADAFFNPVPRGQHRSDIVRLRMLHERGGFYADTDCVALRPWDDLLPHRRALLDPSDNYFMYFRDPGDPLIERILGTFSFFRASETNPQFYVENMLAIKECCEGEDVHWTPRDPSVTFFRAEDHRRQLPDSPFVHLTASSRSNPWWKVTEETVRSNLHLPFYSEISRYL